MGVPDGVESAAVSFNYPISGVLTDAPAFTQRTETAVNSPTSIYTYSSSTDTVAQTMTFTITRPDSTTVQLTRSTNASSPANGRVVQFELKSGAASLGKSVMTYVNDGGGSPQVQSVTGYDDTGTPMKVDFDYDAYGNIINKREYGYQIGGAWQVRRRTRFTYSSAYLNGYLGGQSWMPGLVTLVEVFDALQNTNDADDVLIAKSSYAYDNYVAMGGMENYGGTANPPGHFSYYDDTLTARGNVTGTTQWTDLAAGTTVQHLAKLDILGNLVKAQVSCCQEKDLTNTQATYWSQPESEMSGDPYGAHQTTSTDYDFNTSLPQSATDAGGLTTTYGYDAALNPSSVSLPTGASASAGHDYGNLSSSSSVYYDDGGVFKTLTSTAQYDGWGRAIQSVDRTNAQVNTSYDAMGRVISRTNPFTAGGTPGPATTSQYDALGRGTITTLPGGNTVQNTYSGAAVTVTDQVNRKIQRLSDGLGRLVTVNEQDATGALAQATTYTYDYLDKLTGVNQGGQVRSYKYDAMGRLLYERIPEQSATINDGTGTMWSCKYTYTEFSTVATKQDARGVLTSYSYDSLHRVGGISYDTSGAPGVAATDPVSYGYSSWGAVSNVTVGNWYVNWYTESYTFDGFNRPASLTRGIGDQSTYRLYTSSYQYNGGSQLTQMIYPSGQQVSVNHDDKGRMRSLTYNPGDTYGYLTGLSYNITGQVTGLTLGNGVAENFGYDANRLQMTSQTATKGAASLMNLTYNYQASAGQMGAGSTTGNAGQLMAINNNSTINGTAESAAYTYDNLGRLVTSNQTSNSASAQRRFAYDRWGNRTGMWDATSGGNQIQSVTLEQSGGAPTNRIQTVSTSNGSGGSPSYGGYFDSVDCNTISGWGWDANQPNKPINVDIYDGSTLIATVSANQFRQDLLNAGIGNGVHGYSIATPVSLKNGGAHTIHIKFSGTSTELSNSPKTITCQAPASAAYGGWLDGADCNVITGWAWDGNQPNTAINVEIYDGSTLIAAAAANQFRQDLLNAGIGNGYHGFSIATPASLKNGVAHTIHVKCAGTTTELSGSPKSVSCGGYTYDAAGNVTNDGVHSYTYDAENRVVSVDAGATAQYRYDQQNRRISKIVGSSWTHYIWQGSQMIAEHDATTYAPSATYQVDSARLDYVYSGRQMISSRERASSGGAWTTKYYLSDRLSTRLVLDTSGNVIGQQAHLPFGEDFGESGTQEKHHLRDSESGTDYAVNRQYSQAIGRFNRVDPSGASAKKDAPQTWNRYAYTASDPTNMRDPWGLFFSPAGPDEPDPCGAFGVTWIATGSGLLNTEFCVETLPTRESPDPGTVFKPTCTVFVMIKRIKGKPGILFNHAFLLVVNNQDGATTYYGARSSETARGGVGGVLVGRSGDPNDDNITFGDTKSPVIPFKDTFDGTCDAINHAFGADTNRITARRYLYDPSDSVFGHNSNAFAFSLLGDYGLKMLPLILQVTAWEGVRGAWWDSI
jgi:RHS repeat-associated protein